MTDIVERIECGLDIPPNLILEEILSLRQQLDHTIEECAKKLNIQGKQLAECQYTLARSHANWTKSDKELAECQKEVDTAYEERAIAYRQLAECQARETSLRDDMKLASVQYMGCGGNLLPGEIVAAMTSILNRAMALPFDSTALDTLKKQWQREALLEAADILGRGADYELYVPILYRMAKELE